MLRKLSSCLPFPYMHNTTNNSASAAASPANLYGSVPAALLTEHMLAPPVELAMIVGIEKPDLIVVPQMSALPELLNIRAELIIQLKALKNYHADFDFLIDDMMRFTDESLEPAKIIRYTQRVNIILQAILLYPTLYRYCMKASSARKEVYFTNQHTQFIHSQAIKSLLFLEDAFNGDYLPARPQYRELITRSEKILAWKGLIQHIHQDEQIKQLQQDMHFGAICQFNVSLLYEVQTQLRLSVIVEPLDPLVEIPKAILERALAKAQEYQVEPKRLYEKLYDLSFWRIYVQGQYKQDITVRRTSLMEACQHIAMSVNTLESVGNEEYAHGSMLDARNSAIRSIFTEAIIATMRKESNDRL